MVHFVSTDRVFQEIRVICEVSRAVLAEIGSRVGVNVCVLLQLRRGQETFLTNFALEWSVRWIGMNLLVDLQAPFRLVELQALVALKIARFAMKVLMTEQMRFLKETFVTL